MNEAQYWQSVAEILQLKVDVLERRITPEQALVQLKKLHTKYIGDSGEKEMEPNRGGTDAPVTARQAKLATEDQASKREEAEDTYT